MEKDYAEILLEAIDTVIDSRLNNLPFDKTIVCTIIDNNKREQGVYTVSYDNTTFEAYSDNTAYITDIPVLVVIPEGDWGKKKQIIARYIENEDEAAIRYTSPLDEIIPTINLVSDSTEIGMAANAPSPQNRILVASWSGNADTISNKYLGISAEFKTLFEDQPIEDGIYGLEIILTFEDQTQKRIYFNSQTEFFGDPYKYFDWVKQEQVYQISEKQRTVQVDCYLTQVNKFIYKETKEEIRPIPTNNGEYFKNILLKNFNLFFGHLESETNVLTIQEKNNKDSFSKENNKVQIELLWTNGFDDGVFDDNSTDVNTKARYEILWYEDTETGMFSNAIKNPVSDLGKTTYEYKIPVNLTEARFKAVVVRNEIEYTSNTLVFRNLDALTDAYSETYSITLKSVKPEVQKDGTTKWVDATASFEDYDEDGVLRIASQAQEDRYIQAYLNIKGKEYQFSQLEGNFEFKWKYEENNSMMSIQSIKDDLLAYRIKNKYFPALDNTIACTITVPRDFRIKDSDNNIPWEDSTSLSEEYEGKITISFKQDGIQGTGQNIMVRPIGRKTHFTEIGVDQEFEIIITDSSGEPIKIASYEGLEWYHIEGTEGKESREINENVGRLELTIEYNNSLISLYRKDQADASIHYFTLRLDNAEECHNLFVKTAFGLAKTIPLIYAAEGHDFIEVPTRFNYHSYGQVENKRIYSLSSDDFVWSIIPKPNECDIGVIPTIESGFLLKPAPFYLSNKLVNTVCLVAKDKKDGKIVQSSSIAIAKNLYGTEMLNEWDGSLQIDENNNRVYAATGIFGIKDSQDNTFTGTVIGTIGKSDSQGIASLTAKSGVFGYKNGDQMYALRDDGSFFVGNRNSSYINFEDGSLAINLTDAAQLNIKGKVIDSYIQATAEGFISKVSSKIFTGTVDILELDKDTYYGTIVLDEALQSPEVKIGQIYCILFNNSYQEEKGINLKIGDSNYSYPVYYKNAPISSENKYKWSENTSIYFTIKEINNTRVFLIADNGVYNSYYSLIEQTENRITNIVGKPSFDKIGFVNKVESKTNSFYPKEIFSIFSDADENEEENLMVLDYNLKNTIIIKTQFNFGYVLTQNADDSDILPYIKYRVYNNDSGSSLSTYTEALKYKGKDISSTNNISWEKGDILYLYYTPINAVEGQWNIVKEPNTIYGKIEQTAEHITLQVVNKKETFGSVSLTLDTTNGFCMKKSTQTIFQVNTDGEATFEGIITAKKGGSIGGWNIDGSTGIKSTDGTIQLNATGDTFIKAGNNFTVDKDGIMNCYNANIQNGSKIGPWYINENGITTNTTDSGSEDSYSHIYGNGQMLLKLIKSNQSSSSLKYIDYGGTGLLHLYKSFIQVTDGTSLNLTQIGPTGINTPNLSIGGQNLTEERLDKLLELIGV